MSGIAIVEGNPHLRSLLGWHLKQLGYTISSYDTIEKAKRNIIHNPPSLVILDSDLPDGDGVEFCQWLCKSLHSLIFMLSARVTERDVVKALKAGADDYLKKPFGIQEFLARVESLLRRARISSAPLFLDLGDLKIDLLHRTVEYRGQLVDLTPQEFSLLYLLSRAQGIPLSRTELLQLAWPSNIDNPRTIDTHILSLRKKLEPDPRQPTLIQNVRNVGYRFNPEALKPKYALKHYNNSNTSVSFPSDSSLNHSLSHSRIPQDGFVSH